MEMVVSGALLKRPAKPTRISEIAADQKAAIEAERRARERERGRRKYARMKARLAADPELAEQARAAERARYHRDKAARKANLEAAKLAASMTSPDQAAAQAIVEALEAKEARRLAKKAASHLNYRLRHPDRVRETHKRSVARRRANMTEEQRAALRERSRRRNRVRRNRNWARDPIKADEYRRRYRERHPDRVAASAARKLAKLKEQRAAARTARQASTAGKTFRTNGAEAFKAALLCDQFYRTAARSIPATLPDHVQDDVISAIVLACLEGSLQLEDVPAKAGTFVSAYWRERDFYRTLPLEAPRFEDGPSFLDIIPAPEAMPPEHWHG